MRATISADLYREVHDYINRFGEWGLGMEVLIDGLIESDVVIEPEQYALIHEAMESMGLGECVRMAYLRINGVAA